MLKEIRFTHHFEPQCGWMNDPNGLCYYDGKYHAFFQYNPYEPKWDKMHWGHAVSEDLIVWKQIQTALYPDEEYENLYGCFSGSAIEKEKKLHLFYTAVSEKYGQAQAMAVSSDGVHFEKIENNPIIRYSPYAKDGKNENFRDPKVFEAFGKYYMVVGTCKEEEGQVLLYASKDLYNWEFVNVLYASKDFGGTLECPDMFPLGNKWVLMFSAMKPVVSATVFVVGDFDGKRFLPEKVSYSEFGQDFYAPQTFLDASKRRIMLGWFYHWGKSLPTVNGKIAGALSIPRELSLVNGYVCNYPVKEAWHLLKDTCEYVRVNGTTVSIFGLDKNKVYEKDFYGLNGIRTIEKVEILFDQKAVEIFINDGLVSISQWLI